MSRYDEEVGRAARYIPHIFGKEALVEGMYYAKTLGGFVVMDDELFEKSICPCDLMSYPCRWDEFDGGCRMLRICSVLEKYAHWQCPDGGLRKAENESNEPTECPHLHWEVDTSCRYVVAGVDKEGHDIPCPVVCFKGFSCSCGHDFASGRVTARRRLEAHVRDALHAGARGHVKPRTVLMAQPCLHPIRMPK